MKGFTCSTKRNCNVVDYYQINLPSCVLGLGIGSLLIGCVALSFLSSSIKVKSVCMV